MSLSSTQLFKLLSDQTRLRCVTLIHQEGELCVCEIVHALDIIQPKISRHLAILRDAQLVTDSRQGQWNYYQINPYIPDWMRTVIDITVNQNLSLPDFSQDLKRLSTMSNRPCPENRNKHLLAARQQRLYAKV